MRNLKDGQIFFSIVLWASRTSKSTSTQATHFWLVSRVEAIVLTTIMVPLAGLAFASKLLIHMLKFMT